MSEKLHQYEGPEITIDYNVKRCIHAAECVRHLPVVFDPRRRPWVNPEAASAGEVAAVIQRCPTGALHFTRKDGGAAENPPARNTIRIAADGCLYLHGDFEVVTAEGKSVVKDIRLALCRCGASKNKPFCDNSHLDLPFRDAGNSGTTGAAMEPTDSPGTVRLTLAVDGPVLIQGQVDIEDASGARCVTVAKGALCRCGASKNKPFCDGTHREIAFEAR